jgi:hypothetical protein
MNCCGTKHVFYRAERAPFHSQQSFSARIGSYFATGSDLFVGLNHNLALVWFEAVEAQAWFFLHLKRHSSPPALFYSRIQGLVSLELSSERVRVNPACCDEGSQWLKTFGFLGRSLEGCC